MLSLRHFDKGVRTYLESLRPRFVTFRLETPQVRLFWGIPLWALEETASLLLRLLPLLPHLAPLLPGRARQALAWIGAPDGSLEAAVEVLLSERLHDLLRLPPGEPFISIETADVRIEIRQL